MAHGPGFVERRWRELSYISHVQNVVNMNAIALQICMDHNDITIIIIIEFSFYSLLLALS